MSRILQHDRSGRAARRRPYVFEACQASLANVFRCKSVLPEPGPICLSTASLRSLRQGSPESFRQQVFDYFSAVSLRILNHPRPPSSSAILVIPIRPCHDTPVLPGPRRHSLSKVCGPRFLPRASLNRGLKPCRGERRTLAGRTLPCASLLRLAFPQSPHAVSV